MQELSRLAGCRLEHRAFAFGNERTITLCEGLLLGTARDFERSSNARTKPTGPLYVTACVAGR
jgi:hypothetical protein